MSLTISKELDTQNKLLENLELDIEKNQENTSIIIKKTKELADKAGGTKIMCLIVSLIIVLIILIALVIYT
jgi:t-SNARE complex subunit (syntaxin)